MIADLFEHRQFIDRYHLARGKAQKVDVIVPLLHANELWQRNLDSWFREIPISRLLVGDGGAIDGSVEIVKQFPRVTVFNHSEFATLGKSIAALIDRVRTSWFCYLQSDVFLPDGWFDKMVTGQAEGDWVGCPEVTTVMVQFVTDYSGKRPLAGSQMGRTSTFSGISDFIEDDFVYRQEDFVLANYVRQNGGAVVENHNIFNYHQVMSRRSPGEQMEILGASLARDEDPVEAKRVARTQLFGFVKYCAPEDPQTVIAAQAAMRAALQSGWVRPSELRQFINTHNREWRKKLPIFRTNAPWLARKFFLRLLSNLRLRPDNS